MTIRHSIHRMFAMFTVAGAVFSFVAFQSAPAKAVVNTYEFGYTQGVGFNSIQLILNGSTTINASTSGWYDSTGYHDPENGNYIVGNTNGLDYNNFFVFDLSNVTGPINSATLSLFNPLSPNPGFFGSSATYVNYDITTDLESLVNFNFDATSIFADLGTGTSYASTFVDSSTNGTQVQITLNAAALAAITAVEGRSFAIGGTLTDAPLATPLPAALPMFGAALMGMGAAARRKKFAA